MTKSPEQKAAYQVRREQRLARIKTSTALMAALVRQWTVERLPTDLSHWPQDAAILAEAAVIAADALLAEVERTAPAEGKEVEDG